MFLIGLFAKGALFPPRGVDSPRGDAVLASRELFQSSDPSFRANSASSLRSMAADSHGPSSIRTSTRAIGPPQDAVVSERKSVDEAAVFVGFDN